MQYRAEIDGLRAIAVLPVLFFHGGFEWAEGGYVGVDIFFVISGYLITSILLEDLKAGRFSLIDFYDRRLRRIVPALFVVCIATIPPAWLWMIPQEFDDYAQSLFATAISASNFVFWQESGYFSASNELKPLLHTWSLAVEDQFYLIFPLLLAVLFRGSRVVVGIALLTLASFGLTQILAGAHPDANFYLLPSRFWELGVGALLAAGAFRAPRNAQQSEVLAFAGLASLILSILLIDGNRAYPGWWTLPAVLGTALVVGCAHKGTLTAQILSWRPLVFVGLISYSTYLWHQPLFAFARIRSLGDLPAAMTLALIMLALVLGYLSWRFVERPFRDRTRISRKWIFANTALFGTAIFAFGLSMDQFEPTALRTSDPGLASIEERMKANHGLSEKCEGETPLPDECRTSDAPEILVWGDSFAMHLVDGLVASNPDVRLAQFTKSVCGPFLDLALVLPPRYPAAWSRGCHDFNMAAKAYVERTPSIRYAVLSSALGSYIDPNASSLVAGNVVPASSALVAKSLTDTMNWLRSRGITPVLVTPVPRDGRDIGACTARSLWLGADPEKCRIEKAAAAGSEQGFALMVDAVRPDFKVIDLAQALCGTDTCTVTAADKLLYRDSGHLSHEGSQWLGKKLDFYGLVTSANPSD